MNIKSEILKIFTKIKIFGYKKMLILIIILILFFLIINSGEDKIKYFPHYSRILPEIEKEYYGKKSTEIMINLHLGQFKLLCSEYEFLQEKLKKNDVVIYAGAAPGHHIVFLEQKFPNKFILYDPRNTFDKRLKNTVVDYFTEEEAVKLRKEYKNIIFISDIRTGATEEHDKHIPINMEQQRKWCEILKPRWAMLKFRLPWYDNKPVKYFDGEIYIQPWTYSFSTECRLWTNCKKYKLYKSRSYDNQCFYFNLHSRIAFYEFDKPNIPGFDHCYSCWATYKIFKNKEDIIKGLDFCGQRLDIPPHGLLPEERDINNKIILLKDKTVENIGWKNAKQKKQIKDVTDLINIKSSKNKSSKIKIKKKAK